MTTEQIKQAALETYPTESKSLYHMSEMFNKREGFIAGAESRQQEIDEVVDKALRWDAEVGKQGKIILEQEAEINELLNVIRTVERHSTVGTTNKMICIEILKKYEQRNNKIN